jgi:hypothetical protein
MCAPALARGTIAALSCLLVAPATAQDMEPRRWGHLPVGTDILALAYAYTFGDLKFDPVLEIDDAEVEMHTVLLAYNRYLTLFDTTTRLDVQVPFQSGEWTGTLEGAPASTSRTGFGDPRVRISAALAGAPALELDEWRAFRKANPENTIVGAALAVRLPLGEYEQDRLINLGENRFSFETQLGVVHTSGPWSYELTASAFVFTDNDEFFGGRTREQEPVYAVQAHVVHTFDSGAWVAGGAAFGWGGDSEIDAVPKYDNRGNLLYGCSVGFPLDRSQSVSVGYIHTQTLEDVGSDVDSFLVSWSVRF